MQQKLTFEHLYYFSRYLLILACIISVFVSVSVVSQPGNTTPLGDSYTVDYALGDNDSHASAREIALSKIRLLAAEKAGKYVQGDERLNQERLTQDIRIVSASVVSISNVKETYSIAKNNQATLHLTAIASVDNKALKERILAIQSDADQRKRLAAYESDLATIIQKLKDSASKQATKPNELSAIIAEHNALILNLHATLNAAKLEFSQGFLISEADKNSATVQEYFQAIYEDLYGTLLNQGKINVTYSRTQFNEATGMYDITAKTSWALACNKIPAIVESKRLDTLYNSLSYQQKRQFDDLHGLNPYNSNIPYQGIRLDAGSYSEKACSVSLSAHKNNFISQQILKKIHKLKVTIDASVSGITKAHQNLPVTSRSLSNNWSSPEVTSYFISSSSGELTFHLTKKEAKQATGIVARFAISNYDEKH